VIERGLFVAATTGRRMYVLPLDGSGQAGAPTSFLAGAYGRLRTVVAGPDGALWLTTSNKDGAGKPTPQDDRVIRILPPAGSTNSPA
jgi:glucose/arabinose dehydrogenase